MTPAQHRLHLRRERKLETARKRMAKALESRPRPVDMAAMSLAELEDELARRRLLARAQMNMELEASRGMVEVLEAKLVALIGKRPPLIGRLMTADDAETTQGTLGGNPFSRFNERSIGCTLSQIRPMQNINLMIGATGHGKAESSRFAKEEELCN